MSPSRPKKIPVFVVNDKGQLVDVYLEEPIVAERDAHFPPTVPEVPASATQSR